MNFISLNKLIDFLIIFYSNSVLFYYRVGPIEVDTNIMAHLHNQLVQDLENSDDSASDEEEDAFNLDWEAVKLVYFLL